MSTKTARATTTSGSPIVLQIFRGDSDAGQEQRFEVPAVEGMVVLDAVHYVQANFANDLACRWNCKAAKCGSCRARIKRGPPPLGQTPLGDVADPEIPHGPL